MYCFLSIPQDSACKLDRPKSAGFSKNEMTTCSLFTLYKVADLICFLSSLK